MINVKSKVLQLWRWCQELGRYVWFYVLGNYEGMSLIEMGKTNGKTEIISLFVVTLPSFVVWPGKVILHISYTKEGAQRFMDDYPGRHLVLWMSIEEREIICYGRDKK